MFSEEGRIIFFHIFMDKHKNRFTKPARLIRYLIFLKITIYNQLFFVAQLNAHPSFPFGTLGMHFQALLTPFSHIFCKITFTSVKTKNKSSKFAKKDG